MENREQERERYNGNISIGQLLFLCCIGLSLWVFIFWGLSSVFDFF